MSSNGWNATPKVNSKLEIILCNRWLAWVFLRPCLHSQRDTAKSVPVVSSPLTPLHPLPPAHLLHEVQANWSFWCNFASIVLVIIVNTFTVIGVFGSSLWLEALSESTFRHPLSLWQTYWVFHLKRSTWKFQTSIILYKLAALWHT